MANDRDIEQTKFSRYLRFDAPDGNPICTINVRLRRGTKIREHVDANNRAFLKACRFFDRYFANELGKVTRVTFKLSKETHLIAWSGRKQNGPVRVVRFSEHAKERL